MKLLFLLLLPACFATVSAREPFDFHRASRSAPPVREIKLRSMETGTAKPFAFELTNAFECSLTFALRKASIGFSAAGLSNDDWNAFLFNSDQLFYKPEVRNTNIDWSSHRRWELRLTVVIDVRNIFFSK